jgi:hypothetical protein
MSTDEEQSSNEAVTATTPTNPATIVSLQPIEAEIAPVADPLEEFLAKYDQSPAPNPVDDAFPKSSELYQRLCEQFGAHNVSPLPLWLSDVSDRERVQWYKFGANAFIYFLHKTPKYKETIQKLVDTPLRTFCCSFDQHLKFNSSYGRRLLEDSRSAWIREIKCLVCPCLYPCAFNSHSQAVYLFYPSGGRPWASSDYDCFSCTQFGPFRADFFTALQQSGIKTSDPTCPCCVTVCCSPCVASQYDVIMNYYHYKRIGLRVGLTSGHPVHSIPYAKTFVDFDRTAFQLDINQISALRPEGALYSGALREQFLLKTRADGASSAWIDTQRAFDEHNATWGQTRPLTLPFPEFDEHFVPRSQEVVMQ